MEDLPFQKTSTSSTSTWVTYSSRKGSQARGHARARTRTRTCARTPACAPMLAHLVGLLNPHTVRIHLTKVIERVRQFLLDRLGEPEMEGIVLFTSHFVSRLSLSRFATETNTNSCLGEPEVEGIILYTSRFVSRVSLSRFETEILCLFTT